MYPFNTRSAVAFGFALMVFVYIIIILNSVDVFAGDSKDMNNIGIDDKDNKIQYYLCTDYGDMIHFDSSVSKLRSFEVEGKWREIYRPSGIATYIDGKFGQALKLEGTSSSESVEINNTRSVNPEDLSVSFWIKRDLKQESPGAIISHTSADKDAGWEFIISENGTISFEVTDASGDKFIAISDGHDLESKNPLSSEEFINIIGTFDGTTVNIYSNGHLDEQHPYNGTYIPDPQSPLKIGSSASSAGSLLWTGTIDDLALYNRTLTQDEIRSIYANENSYHDKSTSGLVSHWSFDVSLDDGAASNLDNDGMLRTLISSMVFTPDGRLFFSEKNTGLIKIMEDDKVLKEPFANITDYYVDAEQGLLSLTVDPHFEKNHYIYLYYTANNGGNGIVNQLVRFIDSNNTAQNKVTLIDNIPATTGFHSGGAIGFGPDDKLYLGVGDGTIPEFAQNPDILLGKVLRADRDGKIPEDNPFPDSPVYTLGHRNLFGIAFDNKTGIGVIAENGDELYDEINLITKGGNYGFPTLQPPNIPPEKADPNSSILPIRSYWRTPTPTQTIYYTGDRYPELKDRFLVGTFDGDIYALEFDPIKRTIVEEEWINFEIYRYSAVISVASSPITQSIYFAGTAIYNLTSIDSSNKEQTVFPVSFKFTTEKNNVTDVQIFREENATKTVIEFQTSDLNQNQTQESGSILQIEIPKILVDHINNVTINSDINSNKSTGFTQPTEYETHSSADTTTNILRIKYLPSTAYHLEIFASSAT